MMLTSNHTLILGGVMKTLIKCALIALACSLIFATQTAAAQNCPNSGGATANFDDGTHTPGTTAPSPVTKNLFEFYSNTGANFQFANYGSPSEVALYPDNATGATIYMPQFGGMLLASTGAFWMRMGHGNEQTFTVEIYRRDSSGTVYFDNTWSGTYNSGITSPIKFEAQIPDPNDPYFNNVNYNTYISNLDPVEYVEFSANGNEHSFIKVCTW
jgi:hypothetical protein